MSMFAENIKQGLGSVKAHATRAVITSSIIAIGIAALVGIRERTVHRIVHELLDAGYISVTKDGRNNVYSVDLDKPLRHPLEADHNIQAIIAPLLKKVKRA